MYLLQSYKYNKLLLQTLSLSMYLRLNYNKYIKYFIIEN